MVVNVDCRCENIRLGYNVFIMLLLCYLLLLYILLFEVKDKGTHNCSRA